mmetsp:Transcript_23686/g.71041  ORF Transcript_23686/g.71041 Transcript_23686/m.71041 type:complete len:90 (+) Transcript_23686:144-413(+)
MLMMTMVKYIQAAAKQLLADLGASSMPITYSGCFCSSVPTKKRNTTPLDAQTVQHRAQLRQRGPGLAILRPSAAQPRLVGPQRRLDKRY